MVHNYDYESEDYSDIEKLEDVDYNFSIQIAITAEDNILESIKEIEDDLSTVGGIHEALNKIITNENADIIERLHRLYDEYKNYIEYLKSYERRIRV